ncbi:response regulator [Brucepastera parasyntrophica]|uniref:HD-GYP domain-containing protein n=1 Tax=Brucepastera parasyntrophica TaxID=2880008 RepID=UPI00210A1DC5|nr:HD domain-containing phosphohydrolase [Brucepastera parasyntrophica]ULQ58732.1 response regulator [Brucepastera parasyntrophica]
MALTDNTDLPTVLVVDDVETNLLILEEILKNDYRILTAKNGVEALEILQTMDVLPKIILLDIIMPVMNGYQMLDVLKAHSVFRKIPVIFITTSDSEVLALSSGAVDFISKPFHPEIVKLRVANHIKLKNYSDKLEAMVEQKTAEVTGTLDNILEAMANIIEYRNLESGSHVKRTTYFTRALVDYLLENSEYAEDLRALEPDIIVKAVPLHDVGKIGIPDKILLKPGKLTPEEFDVIKTHTTIGKDIIESILNKSDPIYLNHSRDICYCHHERYDGKGYPRGLKGDDIPLSARILSIVDVYDALVCARVYKDAFPYEEAIRIITEGKGTQFDPVITDAVIAIQEIFKEISIQNQ